MPDAPVPAGGPVGSSRPAGSSRSAGSVEGQASAERSGAARRRAGASRAGSARLPVVGTLAALLVAGGLVDHAVAPPGRTPPAAPLPAVPAAAPAAASSSSWFCAGATDGPPAKAPAVTSGASFDVARGHAPGKVVIANAGVKALTATVTIVASTSQRRVVTVPVQARSRATVAEVVRGGAPWVAATVELNGGDASVEQQVGGPLGVSATPCATSGSRHWYFPTGATLVNEGVQINLFNPYPASAIVDLSFTTNEGPESPGTFEGLVVPAKGLLSVDLGSRLRRRTSIATTVTARNTPVVAWETTVVTPPAKGAVIVGSRAASAPGADPAAAVAGVSDTLGAASAGRRWWWPAGQSAPGVRETYKIYDPGPRRAKVRLSIHLDAGKAEPFDLSVAPGAVATVTSSAEARIPSGVGHSATLTSLNGVPVVGERTVVDSTPSPYSGRSQLMGAQVSAARWLLGAGSPGKSEQEQIVVSNPGTSAVRATLASLRAGSVATVPGAGHLVIEPGQRDVVTLGGKVASGTGDLGAVLVTASGPVVVERDLFGVSGARGVASSIGTPIGLG